MENYFQAEAFNLDKVLDEFEQNEDETESPSVFEAKWSQILDPPSHLLSLNPALSNVNMAALPSEMQARLKCHSSSSKSEIGLCGRGDRCHGNNTTGNLLLDRPQTNAEGVPERNKNSNCEHWSNSSPPVKPACENELYFSEDMNSSSVFGLIVQNSDSQLSHCGVVLQEDNSNNQNLMNVSTFVVENTNLQSGQLSSDMNGQTEKTVSLKSIEQLNTNCTDEMCVKSSFESLRNSVDLENLPPTSKESWMVNDLSVKICEQDVTSGLDGDTEINEVSDSFSRNTEINDVAVEFEERSVMHVENNMVVRTEDVDGDLPEITNTQILDDLDNFTGLKINSEKTQPQRHDTCSVNSNPNLTSEQYNSSNSGKDDGHHFESGISSMSESSCQKTRASNDNPFTQGCTIDLSYHAGELSSGSEVIFNQVIQHVRQSNHRALEDDALVQNGVMKEAFGNNDEIVFDLTEPSADTVVPSGDWLGSSTAVCADMKEQVSTPYCLCDGLDSTSTPTSATICVSKPLPLKEDSVTEEKEIEESKSECYNYVQHRESEAMETGLTNGLTRLSISTDNADQIKDNYFNTPAQSAAIPCVRENVAKLALNNGQPISIPFGGARPKQPLNLKLQIPKPLTNQLLNDLGSANPVNNTKNKNIGFTDKVESLEDSVLCALNGSALVPDCSVNGDDLGVCYVGASKDINSDHTLGSESPDNDLGAGQFPGALRKPFTSLGDVAPVWVPDSQAPNCMKCEQKFTFTKRRHHCRACGKVFCAACCSLKCKLNYMDMKEARVCVTCHTVLNSSQAWENTFSASASSPNPNNPAEYCSTIPPLQQAQASGALSSPPPTVMVPVGVLKHPGTEVTQPKEQRRVWFADGILPNGEVADATKLSASGPPPTGPLAVSHDRGKEAVTKSTASENVSTSVTGSTAQIGSPVGSSINLVPEDGLPPILISTGVKGDYAVEEQPSQLSLMLQLEEGGPDPLVFVLNANLLVMVKLVNYVNRKCWSFTTKGMHAVGQAEIIILLQCLPDEKCIPKDIFSHCIQLYQDALAGNVVGDLGHSFFAQSFLGSREHGGFLYVTATFQSMQDLVLPNPPYLFGILIQKWETPWAKVFPIRLMLRLGAEYRYYPCPLFSVRFRKPLFGETGHTIMNLLADFRNYQYKLPVVQGLVVNMEVRKTCIHIPSNRYNEMMKAMNKSNEHVLAFGACFNEKADSHLVCVQNDDGNYQTQAISIHNQPRKVTGASFFVFSGALKSSSGYLAKSSIVEDGMMVQISAETMDSLRQALREMKDFTITCGKIDAEEPQEHVHIQWTEDDKNINKGVVSPIDGKSMDEIASVKIFHGSEFKTNGKVIRWTEVFFLQSEDQPSSLSDPADHSKLTENVAKAFCLALCPHLKLLKEDGKAKLGLRVTLDSDQVGYQAGSNGQPLPSQYMNDLDNALVPVIHGGACQLSEGSVVMELIFYILESFS
ncbi:zinc finger FYVE domain-containing protein 9-like isoform X1 [Stegostoma tigrinum]|uniref:zinc finger FYVE domain-containing protein 9-like isoform X1 n=1 Tax=Stegostoma tigrinum TaxID=3053191 RepID=UPI00202ADD44|nr:zinc finger FYVE domain-containing protein 9-like isoform X1 [Stegostoma tigrinum]XP_048395225.1 zinc finger FYVE domain-containing protein 9-like isoform X1 [Stegostoma tigrinum]XP_048395226.1 zinc finger FYVE domain-containing protein 9-like isoform X1 [Stegostoma tigrinum]XP_059503925.1 zinc finger FYVE domain-containing protein 9-like isoform X1 [Stegostoma tigrinum]